MGRWYRQLPAWQRWGVGCAAFGLAWLATAQFASLGAPTGIVVQGAVIGGANALGALGIILIWRSHRIINFASGVLGAAVGSLCLQYFLYREWNYWLCWALALAGGATIGALSEILVVRRFSNASRLVLTVATLGLAQLLGGIEYFLPKALLGNEFVVLSFEKPSPISSHGFELGAVLITGDYVAILAVVPVVVVALAVFLQRSAWGLAIRASAENTERARLLGVPVRRINTLAWTIAGLLSALAFVLKTPVLGAPATVAAGPTIILASLAAAVLAGMESMPRAFVASMVLGVMEQLIWWNISDKKSLSNVALLVVILVGLLAQNGPANRARDADNSLVGLGSRRPIPHELADHPLVRVTPWVVGTVAVIAAVAVPLSLSPSNLRSVVVACLWAIVGISLVVLTGWAGQISLGQFAFVGAGALVAGNLMTRWNLDLFVCMAAAAAAGALIALLLGLPALRIRGPFLAVVTMAFALVMDSFVINQLIFPDLIPNDVAPPVLWERFALDDQRTLAWFSLALLGVVGFVARSVRIRQSGRSMVAVRDNRRAAEAATLSQRWVTLTSFVLAGAIAGSAGALHVMVLGGLTEGTYAPIMSIDVFSMTTIGGLGSVAGGGIGAFGMRLLYDAIRQPEIRLMLTGTGLLVVLWLLPGGLTQVWESLRDRVLRRVAASEGISLGGFPPTAELGDRSSAQTEGGGSALDARGVSVSYGSLRVLFDVDLAVQPGEMVALLGTNGAGKSTVLKAVCGLIPSSGDIRLADPSGEAIPHGSPEQLVRRGVALMPGGKSIFPTLTVDEHLRLAAWTFRRDSSRVADEVGRVLATFPALEGRGGQLAGDMSGGEQQQLALAQTLMLRPHLLMIDELSLGLSPTIVGMLIDIVRDLNASGTTIIVVEQSINVALTLAQRAVFLEKGQVRFEGATRDLLDRPDILRSVFLEGAAAVDPNVLDAVDTGQTGRDTDGAEAVQDGTAREKVSASTVDLDRFASWAPEPMTVRGELPESVLDCREVSKRFGGVIAVDAVDLRVAPGEIVGLIGQNGAGKTTLLDCISGFHELDGGRIHFRGVDVTEWATFERARGSNGPLVPGSSAVPVAHCG